MHKISVSLVSGFLSVLMMLIVTTGYCQAKKKVNVEKAYGYTETKKSATVSYVKENVSRGVETVKSQLDAMREASERARKAQEKALGKKRRILAPGEIDNPEAQ